MDNLARKAKELEASGLKVIRAQDGPQREFTKSRADVTIFGGSAGGGKSFALLMEAARHIGIRGYGAVVFRRTVPQVRNEGGLWDQSHEIYPILGGEPKQQNLAWVFPPHGCRVKFAHMQYEDDRYDWDGAQIPFIGFDQLEHFTKRQFFYMFARNRTTCGVKPYIRATCNPDPDSFLRDFLCWWIDDETGFVIPERSGVTRWFVRVEDEIVWADEPGSLVKKYGPDQKPKSCTFIPSSIYDNKILLKKNPEYLANLMALSLVDRERLLKGNWNIRESAGNFFRREWLEIVDAAPGLVKRIRYWERAASAGKDDDTGSYTVGLEMGLSENGTVYICDVIRFKGNPGEVERTIKNTASQDGKERWIGLEQDPGQAGKVEVQSLARQLAGYKVLINAVRESKGIRAKPLSAQAEAGNVKLVRGSWVESFIQEAVNFDGVRKPNDQIDAASGAYQMLIQTKGRAGVWGTEYVHGAS